MNGIKRDKFWDRSNQYQSRLDPAEYHDLAEETSVSGRPLSSLLPAGTWGATGCIVRRATEEGAPIGYDPHCVATEVVVDPDIPGQSFVLDMSKIRKEAMETALKPHRGRMSSGIEERRFAASNVFRQFATGVYMPEIPQQRMQPREAPLPLPGMYVCPPSGEGGGQLEMPTANIRPIHTLSMSRPVSRPAEPLQEEAMPTPQSMYPQAAPPPQQGQPYYPPQTQQPAYQQATYPQPQSPQAPNGWSGVANGNGNSYPQPQPQAPYQEPQVQQAPRQPQQPASLFRRSPGSAPMVAPAANQPNGEIPIPQFKVGIQVRDNPIVNEAYFHQVIREGACLILVFDTRAVGYPRIFPQATAVDVAIRVGDSPTVLITQVPNIRFPLNTYDVCVLLIKDEFPIEQLQQGA
jgi:hypothetical protein